MKKERTSKMSNVHPVVETAKSLTQQTNVIVLADGKKAKLNPISASLIDEVTSRIEDPMVPMWHNPEKDRDEPNPSDPEYLRKLAKANRERGAAAIDAIVMFGIELLEGVPDDNSWLDRLKLMERLGKVDLSIYDLSNPIDKEFLYKRFVAVSNDILTKISEVSGITPSEVEKAEKSFRGNS
jgi:hypothetical protein